MHKRITPRVNHFNYAIYYLALPLSQLAKLPIRYNRPGLLSFYDCDHGACDGSDLQGWARELLEQQGLNTVTDEIILMCMPRVFGYVFNPVSFWLCLDNNKQLRAVLCEVHNTFGERHTYLCKTADNTPIQKNQTLTANKVFHVSPFFEREGHYQFQFDCREDTFTVHIKYYLNGQKQLLTCLSGSLQALTAETCQKAFWRYPLITLKAIFLIHWQALKLLIKRVRYVKKPIQLSTRLSQTENLTNN